MAQSDHNLALDESLEVVEALYQEAELIRPSHLNDDTMPQLATTPIASRPVIRSYQPALRTAAAQTEILTRINEMFDEAESLRDTSKSGPAFTPRQSHDDDFQLPDSFAKTDEQEPITLDSLPELPELPDDNGPAILLDDDAPDEANLEEAQDIALDNAVAADTDDETTQIDDSISRELDDVKQAVETAREQLAADDAAAHDVTSEAEAEAADIADREPLKASAADAIEEEDPETANKAEPALQAGPELARFIGETVREVLDEELPTMVRGMVDEALNERKGRYGHSHAPYLGLRTKSSSDLSSSNAQN